MQEFCFSIDRGGTFTDIYALTPKGPTTLKLLSENTQCYLDAPREGIRRILSQFYQTEIDPSCIDESPIKWIRMGTTVATNALLERNGEPLLWLTTKGFKDLLKIGTQNRPKIFDLQIILPQAIYHNVLEVDERVHWLPSKKTHHQEIKTGLSGESYWLEKEPNLKNLETQLVSFYQKGIRSLAISLMHGYDFQEHEKKIGALAQKIGFTQISLSCEICPQIKLVHRGDTTTLDAYLTPHIQKYLQSFRQGFKHQLKKTKVLFMQSNGGLINASQFFGSRAILSGPAGGVVGYSTTTPGKSPLIGFDMGGTSTDVSRYFQDFEMIPETEISGVRLQIPQMSIQTVAAGGGSKLTFRDGKFLVGPESVRADPGPVCYGKKGKLAVTDANLLLGRLVLKEFPKVFGPNEDQSLNLEKTIQAIETLKKEINQKTKKQYTQEEIAFGFIQVANEIMARPIREISIARGYDIKQHHLVCFGGASGQHACAIARKLGIKKIFLHKHASILSAVGLSKADLIQEKSLSTYGLEFQESQFSFIKEKFASLEKRINNSLEKEGIEEICFERYLNMRAEGAFHPIMIPFRGFSEAIEDFRQYHLREFGFELFQRAILVDDLRVRGIGKTPKEERKPIEKAHTTQPKPNGESKVYFETGWTNAPYFSSEFLKAGHHINGPALILLAGSCIVIEPNCQALINQYGDIEIQVGNQENSNVSEKLDPIQLSIFNHLFMSVAEQMGRTLQRIAVSTNIKERLDFSCAIFDEQGGLVANAPHIPVHLGAMGESVKAMREKFQNNLQPGDVLVTNDPYAGGSHLPDITVISPVWNEENSKILFFAASRGHHADIGGITPGSMPPFSTKIQEEGVRIEGMKIVEKDSFQEEKIRVLFSQPGKGIPGSRKIEDNLADLRAQIAANQKGVELLKEMIDSYGLAVVTAYMGHIQKNAEEVILQVIQELKTKFDGKPLTATEPLDDGSLIHLKIEFLENGNIRFDFSQTDPELIGNLNAPRAITYSAVLYVMRTLVEREIPLNAGCLKPVEIFIPENTLLSPSFDSAVVGGNVETSQRVVDVILKALQVTAGSQGTMNNLTFGNKNFGYYETIAGGAGASEKWPGQHAVHTHMTNTKITDPEVLERAYPVLLREFSIRKGSGGCGQFPGGDGIIREIEFQEEMNVSMLSERRTFPPYGLNGGQPGKCGKNLILRTNGKKYILGGKGQTKVEAGDRIRIETPGGGGFGTPPPDKI